MTITFSSPRSKSSHQFARLHLHEFEDHSDSEEVLPYKLENNYAYLVKCKNVQPQAKQRSASAGARSSFVRDMEARLAGLRHEKMKSQMSGASRDERLSGLLYDPDFDCYYNPVDDQYYRLQPTSKDS
ncbi:hypothetical protein COOONC_15799 [Cooperia oncophora]